MTDAKSIPEYAGHADTLTRALHLAVPPVAMSFRHEAPPGMPWFDAPMSAPADDGRTGRVPAGCVFWVRATELSFATAPEDHGNCSVGRYTHGLASAPEIAGNSDVAALLDAGWVDADAVAAVPTVRDRAEVIAYGPLADTTVDPDVVLLRVNARQMMVLSDAVPGMRIEGKPQCRIVALAKEEGEIAASVGCALSRARTSMRPDEMTVAIPGPRLAEVTDAVDRAASIDTDVAMYAAEDARRFVESA